MVTRTTGRQELRTVLDFLRKGDVLMVTRIDRLARNIGNLQDIVRTAEGASICLVQDRVFLFCVGSGTDLKQAIVRARRR